MFTCTECDAKFKEKKSFNGHNLFSHQSTAFHCATCGKGFSRKDNLLRHASSHNPTTSTVNITMNDPTSTKRLKPSLPDQPNVTPNEDELMCQLMDRLESGEPILTPCSKALYSSLRTYRVEYMYPILDPILFLNQMVQSMENLVDDYLQMNTGVKLWVCLLVQYYKDAYHCTKQISILQGDQLSIKMSAGFPKILKSVDKFQSEGSGWVIKQIFQADIHLSRYRPLRGNCYKPLPRKLQDKKAVINVQNEDDKCFLWSILAHLHPVSPGHDHPQRLCNYTPYENSLDTTGAVLPMEFKDIPFFERANRLSINVYGWEDLVYPLYISEAPGRHIDLLYFEGHYCLIRNLDRLLSDGVDDLFHEQASKCSICQKDFLPDETRVYDHFHICGKYRGPAHNACNIDYQLKREIVVVLHNLRRHDSHLIMQAIGGVCNDMELKLECVARGMEDYLSFSIRNQRNMEKADDEDDEGNIEQSWRIKFIDSCLFLLFSLENLVGAMPKDKFYAVQETFGDDTPMLLRKGVFPYDYFDYPSKLEDTCLPPIEVFHSKLNNEEISEQDYTFAKTVWDHFNMATFLDYHNLYLMLDVLSLADVFTEFRKVSLHNYALDPSHYITLPSSAWDAC